jgi:hypothetical protein
MEVCLHRISVQVVSQFFFWVSPCRSCDQIFFSIVQVVIDFFVFLGESVSF